MLLNLHTVGLQISMRINHLFITLFYRKLKSHTIKTGKPKMAQQTTTKVIKGERVCWFALVFPLNWSITVYSSWQHHQYYYCGKSSPYCCIKKIVVSSIFTFCKAGLTFLCFPILMKPGDEAQMELIESSSSIATEMLRADPLLELNHFCSLVWFPFCPFLQRMAWHTLLCWRMSFWERA